MRPHHFIVVLFLLLSSVLLSACLDSTSLLPVSLNDTSPKTLLVNVTITENQNAIDGKSKLTFQFSSNLIQGGNIVQFTHHETITCNGVSLKLDNPPYTLSVQQGGGGYNCSYTGYTQDNGSLGPAKISIAAQSILAPQRPIPSGTGYTIKYNPDSPGTGCPMQVDAKDGTSNPVSGATSSDQGVYQGADITSLGGDGSILLQRTCTSTPHSSFDTVNVIYESTAIVAVTWSH